jgi:hypothetical protein
MRSRERVRGGAPRAELGRSSRSLSSPSKKISWGKGIRQGATKGGGDGGDWTVVRL